MIDNGVDGNSEMITLAYADSVPDTTLLLIHGFPLSSRMWEPQLAELGMFVRVIAPDLRGFGDSEAAEDGTTMTEYVEDCVALIEALGIDGPLVVAGHSMGGYVALEFVRRHPEKVDALILISTKAGADGEEARAGRDAMASRVAEEGIDVAVAAMLPKLLADESYEAEPELVDEIEEVMRGASIEGVVAALGAMRDRADSTELLASIAVPALVVHGSADRVMPSSEGEALAEAIPGAELAMIDAAGHLPNLEQMESFNSVVADFLARLADERDD